MLGLSDKGNDWKYIVSNFFIVFGSQVGFELFELLPTGVFPSAFEFYKATITAFISALAFYGINKARTKK